MVLHWGGKVNNNQSLHFQTVILQRALKLGSQSVVLFESLYFHNSPIMWSSKKHNGIQALSSTEAELIQATLTIRKILWIQPLISHLGYKGIVESTFLHADNQSAIANLKTDVTHGRTKHSYGLEVQILRRSI